jgi:hypothetical protein
MILNAVRRQFIKFRDLQNRYLKFLVNLVREEHSLIHNKPYEYPNFYLELTQKHRAEFKELKTQGKIPATETLPSSSKARLRKYFYDYYSEPHDTSWNLSAFDTASFHSLTLIERAKQKALQYPFHAVRNWFIRNERIKTIGRYIIFNFNLNFMIFFNY